MQKHPIPRKLNNGMITALSEAIAKGNYAVTACQLCGISEPALWAWLKQGQQDDDAGLSESIYLKLLKSLKKAEAEAENRLVAVVREAAEVKREWLPAITFLERRHPDRWGRRERRQIDISEVKEIRITHVEVRLNEESIIESRLIEGGENGQERTGQVTDAKDEGA